MTAKRDSIIVIFLFIFLASISISTAGEEPNGFSNYQAEDLIERHTPIGTVREPGSQLIYILDTGFNPLYLEEYPGYRSQSVMELTGVETPHYTNWISITNTSRRYSVTLHFQYYNCYLEPILEFLVVMSCNDTMMVNAFDLVIPNSDGINVRNRFFGGYDQLLPDQQIPSLSAARYGDGRFLLSVTSVGDPKGMEAGDLGSVYSPRWEGNPDTYEPDYKNLDLFPLELVTWTELETSCPAYSEGEIPPDVVGNRPGLDDDNLHIFNASPVSFNYLVGLHVVACATPYCNQSYMVDPFVRPARNRTDALEDDPEFFSGRGVPVGLVLSGGERIYHQLHSGPEPTYLRNQYYLRWDSGDAINRGRPELVDFEPDYEYDLLLHSKGGSEAWAFHPVAWSGMFGFPPPSQYLNMLSLADDYNGSSTSANSWFPDRGYGLTPLVSVYLLTLFNNSQDYLPAQNPEEILRPTPEDYPFTTAMAVKGMNAWTLEGEAINARLGQNLYRFGIDDIYRIRGEEMIEFLPVPEDLSGEIGQGWVRFTRLMTTGIWETSTSSLKKFQPFDGEFSSLVTVSQYVAMFRGTGYGTWGNTSGYEEERFNRLFQELLEAAGN